MPPIHGNIEFIAIEISRANNFAKFCSQLNAYSTRSMGTMWKGVRVATVFTRIDCSCMLVKKLKFGFDEYREIHVVKRVIDA